MPNQPGAQPPARTSNAMLIAALALAIFMLFTPVGVFTGFGLAVLTNLAIFVRKDLRDGITFPVLGVLVLGITGFALVQWFF